MVPLVAPSPVNSLIRSFVLLGAATVLVTELLSPFHLLRRAPLAATWIVLLAAVAVWLWKHPVKWTRPRIRPVEAIIAAVIFGIVCTVGVTAIASPPNSADAMAYHMPRVVYWAQSGSVAFFPTPYLNQISLPPIDEYFLLNDYILSGGDRWANLVAFFGFVGSIIGVAALAGALGLTSRGQAMAALFCATLPNFILQASGAKNDSLASLWLVALVYFIARRDLWFAGLALGLAVGTKSTAYLFAPPLIAALWLWFRPSWRRLALTCAAGVLLINTPQFLRNFEFSGSPLGFDSAQGDGFFRWRNEHPGVKSTVSNALRHFSEQLGGRSERWNRAVYDGVVRVHQALGLDPQDADTTFRWSRYEQPRNANHEANANNRWHLLLAAVAVGFACLTRRRNWLLYSTGLTAAFLLFCFYLKWQPFLSRLELPLFVLAAPLAGMLLEAIRPAWLALPVCLFLVASARLPLLENWTRPLRGPHNLFATPRDRAYFNDMSQWNNRTSYVDTVDAVARSRCNTVGLDISENQLEYPFQTLLRERNAEVRFVHTGVDNASTRYAPSDAPRPCAVLCLDCIGNAKKLDLYRGLGEAHTVGRFLLFLP